MYGIEIYAAVRHYIFVEGHTREQAAIAFGISRSMVLKMCRYSLPPGHRRTHYVKHKLGQFVPVVEEIIRKDQLVPEKQRHTVERIFRLLKDEHGYRGAYSTLQKYVTKIRGKLARPFIPLVHEPGHAQVDFGKAVAIIGGVRQQIHFFCFIFSHSDAPFVKAYPAEKNLSFMDGHISAFEYFRGVPNTILYDNSTLAVARFEPDGSRRRAKGLSELVSHYLFTDRFCRVAHGNDKVETLVRFSRRNFLTPVPVVDSFEELNAKLEKCCTRRRTDTVKGAKRSIGQALKRDLKQCRRLPLRRLDPHETREARVSKASLVFFEGNYYSVPTTYVGRLFQIRAGVFDLQICDGGAEIARHKRAYGREEIAYRPLHYLALLEQRPGALDQAAPLKNWKLPEVFGRLRAALELRFGDAGKREYISTLRLLENFEEADVESAIKRGLGLNIITAKAIRRLAVARVDGTPIDARMMRYLRRLQGSINEPKHRHLRGGRGTY
jgi:transposase